MNGKQLLSLIEKEMQNINKDEQIALGGTILRNALNDESTFMKQEFLKGLENDLISTDEKLKLFSEKVVLQK